jgi:hypothetical protein
VCDTADVLDDGHMVLAAEPDRELMWLAAAIERRQAIVHALLLITKVSVGSMITQPGNLL